MNYNLIYVETKEEERIVISENECTLYSNEASIKEDFEVLRKVDDTCHS